jgi:hypothetical protein
MIAIAQEATPSALDVSIWERDQEIGLCFLDAHGRLAVKALHPEQQTDLIEFILVEYAIQKKHAREAGIPFDVTTFLVDLPRTLHGYYSAQRVRPSSIVIPAPFSFTRFDRSAIPSTPRRKRTRA